MSSKDIMILIIILPWPGDNFKDRWTLLCWSSNPTAISGNGTLYQWQCLPMLAMFATSPTWKANIAWGLNFNGIAFHPDAFICQIVSKTRERFCSNELLFDEVFQQSPLREATKGGTSGVYSTESGINYTRRLLLESQNFGWNFFSVFRIGRFVTKQRFSNSFPKEFRFCLQFVPKETKSLWVYQEKMVRYIPRKAGSGL